MIRLLTLALVAAMTGSVSAQKQQTLHSGYPIDPVPFTSVKVTDSFWGQRLKASREVTIRWLSVSVRKRDVMKTL